ncbi:MAG: hypothetical protein E6778_14625, partial [Niallia nealsonii]|nr:hypothetical protein [Niallia nealsonii]
YTSLSVGLALSLLSFASGVSGCLANPTGVYVYSGCSIFPTNSFFLLKNNKPLENSLLFKRKNSHIKKLKDKEN